MATIWQRTECLGVLVINGRSNAALPARVNLDAVLIVLGGPLSTIARAGTGDGATIRETVVAWAAEDAALDSQAGRQADADQTAAEAKELAAGPGIQINPALPANLFPSIPEIANNPYAQNLFAKSVEGIDLNERFPKGEIKIRTAARGWNYITLSEEGRELLLAFIHPQSRYHGDTRLLLRSLRIIENGLDGWLTSEKTLADFGTFDNYTQDYLLLKAALPAAILPSKKIRWEKAIALNAEKVAAKESESWNDPGPHRTYLNSDVRYMNGIAYAGAVLERRDLTDLAAKGLVWNSGALLPDGAFNYLGNQTECFTYHEVDLFSFAEYYLFTGDDRALDVIRKSRHYYPLSIDPRGVAEYFTAPSWKHAWNTAKNEKSAALVALLTGDGQNLRLGEGAGTDFLLACFYKSPVQPAPAPDDYILYDGNISGPRGRFGDFSFAGVLLDPSALRRGPWGFGLGRGTVVGAMQLDPETGTPREAAWPMNAVVNGVSIGLRVKPDDGTASPGELRTSQRYMMQDIQGQAIVRPQVASIVADYHLTDKTDTGDIPFKALPWRGRQMWVMLPDRMIGWVELQADSAQDALGVLGRIELLSGRASWGVKKPLESLGDGRYLYGKLKLHIVEQNLGQPVMQKTAGIYAGANTSSDDKFLILNLAPPDNALKHYTSDQTFHFILEVRSASADAEASVDSAKLAGGLLRLGVHQSKRDWWLYFNPQNVPADAHDALDTRSHQASIQDTAKAAAVPVSNGKIRADFAIPPEGSRLLVASDQVEDHASKSLTYEQIFDSASPGATNR